MNWLGYLPTYWDDPPEISARIVRTSSAAGVEAKSCTRWGVAVSEVVEVPAMEDQVEGDDCKTQPAGFWMV